MSVAILRICFGKTIEVGFKSGRCVVKSSEVIECKKSGKDYPYVFREGLCEHAFVLDHSDTEPLYRTLLELVSCNQLSARECASRLARIVSRHRDAAKPFNLTYLIDIKEEILMDRMCSRVQPFVLDPCRFVISSQRLYLQPLDDVDGECYTIELSLVRSVYRRRHSLREVGLELILSPAKNAQQENLFVAFGDMSERDRVYDVILRHPVVALALDKDSSDLVTRKWMNGQMSNYDYLMYVNSLGDRTKNDMAQYPVFPWILADYTSKSLDLNNPKTFRDLSKPVGALNPSRLEGFRSRMREMEQDGQEFLYGTHYSTPGYVLFYLVRKRPDLMLRLQNGKFDAPDRAFYSIYNTWQSCLNSQTDVKELIPEFFTDPSIFENVSNLDLGTRQNGARVYDVELPPWCDGSARTFVELHRMALESDYVSEHLHEWIDLVFGFKQRGEEAKKADNLFYPLTYQGSVDVTMVDDDLLKASLETQISEFGQTPKQAFFAPHPKRRPRSEWTKVMDEPRPTVVRDDGKKNDDNGRKRVAASVEHEVLDHETLSVFVRGASGTVSSSLPCLWNLDAIRKAKCQSMKLHREVVTGIDLDPADERKLISVSEDGFVKVHVDFKQTRATTLCNSALTCVQMLTSDTALVGSLDTKIYSYSIKYNKVMESLHAHDDSVSALRMSNNRLVTGGWDTLVRLWNIRNDGIEKIPVFETADLEGQVLSVDVSSSGTFVACSSDCVLFGDFRTPGYVVRQIRDDSFESCRNVRFLGDGIRVVAGCHLVNPSSDDLLPICHESVSSLCCSGSLAALAIDQSVQLWDCSGSPKKLEFLESNSSFCPDDSLSCMSISTKTGYFTTQSGNLLYYTL